MLAQIAHNITVAHTIAGLLEDLQCTQIEYESSGKFRSDSPILMFNCRDHENQRMLVFHHPNIDRVSVRLMERTRMGDCAERVIVFSQALAASADQELQLMQAMDVIQSYDWSVSRDSGRYVCSWISADLKNDVPPSAISNAIGAPIHVRVMNALEGNVIFENRNCNGLMPVERILSGFSVPELHFGGFEPSVNILLCGHRKVDSREYLQDLLKEVGQQGTGQLDMLLMKASTRKGRRVYNTKYEPPTSLMVDSPA